MALGALPGRFGDPPHLVLFVVYFLALLLLLATDLDQRLLPDLVTLPLIPAALAVRQLGLLPDGFGPLWGAVAIAILLPAGLYLLSVPFGAGAIGIGDLKLLVGVGLLSGLVRTIVGIAGGALLAGVVVLALLLTRRVGLRTYIPFGPFLIIPTIGRRGWSNADRRRTFVRVRGNLLWIWQMTRAAVMMPREPESS